MFVTFAMTGKGAFFTRIAPACHLTNCMVFDAGRTVPPTVWAHSFKLPWELEIRGPVFPVPQSSSSSVACPFQNLRQSSFLISRMHLLALDTLVAFGAGYLRPSSLAVVRSGLISSWPPTFYIFSTNSPLLRRHSARVSTNSES